MVNHLNIRNINYTQHMIRISNIFVFSQRISNEKLYFCVCISRLLYRIFIYYSFFLLLSNTIYIHSTFCYMFLFHVQFLPTLITQWTYFLVVFIHYVHFHKNNDFSDGHTQKKEQELGKFIFQMEAGEKPPLTSFPPKFLSPKTFCQPPASFFPSHQISR